MARVYVRGDLIAGKYRLRQVLGKGGMGEVWAAVNTHLDAPVAIKVIRTGTDNEEARQRLIHEARATARLRHRAIVRVFDVGETELGDPFIVMERLTGETLGRLLERRRLISGEQAAQIVLPILHALAAAHRAGIVHRDVKPDNVFLEHTDTGLQPKLLDFGVVKLQQEQFAGDLTNTGTTLGSPFYMSPEQARGLVVDQRVDLWSVAVVLYEAVTGRMPFVADNYNALLRAIIEDKPAPIDESKVDPSLAAIIMQGLARDHVARWQSADELGRALALWLSGQGIKTDITGASIAATWLESDRVRLSSVPGSIPPPSCSDEWLERAESGLDVTQPRESAIVERTSGDFAGAQPVGRRRSRLGVLAALFVVSAALAFWGIRAGFSGSDVSTTAEVSASVGEQASATEVNTLGLQPETPGERPDVMGEQGSADGAEPEAAGKPATDTAAPTADSKDDTPDDAAKAERAGKVTDDQRDPAPKSTPPALAVSPGPKSRRPEPKKQAPTPPNSENQTPKPAKPDLDLKDPF